MPRTIEFRAEGAHIDLIGIVTGGDLFGINDGILGHEYPGKPRYALFDFSGAERIDVTPADLRRIAEEDERDAERIGDLAVAVVAPQTLMFGLARMWEGLVDPLPFDSQVVRTRPDALRWLANQGIVVE